jgi:hypothetical protein
MPEIVRIPGYPGWDVKRRRSPWIAAGIDDNHNAVRMRNVGSRNRATCSTEFEARGRALRFQLY